MEILMLLSTALIDSIFGFVIFCIYMKMYKLMSEK